MAVHKRRLSDLWVTGRELIVDDGQGEPVVLWLQKLNSIEGAESSRAADAARARTLAVKANPDSDEYQAIRGAVLDYGQNPIALAEFLLMDDKARLRLTDEAQMAAEEEWSKDNYLQGLNDAWANGLSERWLKADPKEGDIEANRVFLELKRFNDEVADQVERDLEGPRERFLSTPLEELQTQMIDKLIDIDAGQNWLDEFYRQQLYFGTREPDNHGARYFVDRAEVDELATATYRLLRSAFENLEVDVMEGKDSPAPPTSSPSSEQDVEAETVPSPGLAAAGR